MAKRKDSASSGIVASRAQLGYEVKQGVNKDGTEYRSVSFYVLIPGCPVPLRLSPKSMMGADGQVLWLDVAGRSLKEIALSGGLPS